MDWNGLSEDANRCCNDDAVNGVCSLLAQTNYSMALKFDLFLLGEDGCQFRMSFVR